MAYHMTNTIEKTKDQMAIADSFFFEITELHTTFDENIDWARSFQQKKLFLKENTLLREEDTNGYCVICRENFRCEGDGMSGDFCPRCNTRYIVFKDAHRAEGDSLIGQRMYTFGGNLQETIKIIHLNLEVNIKRPNLNDLYLAINGILEDMELFTKCVFLPSL